ncbi:solute:sodium symporter family transporter [Rubripirellula reticaptiva]|uniref:Putative symporter YidK n=1 Tax=Rubripirellula reticaptiva TaxID=2528013 RepID=A0A5C6EL38_9BACT|nr:solute:sodium symporter family transporter [Rubripirellula reticaptiva]TWU48316.1 putative symporter YidK [Rubripirellula reticaptiva]
MLTLVSFIFFTALVGVLTYLLVRGKESESSDGYFLAGRSLTAGVIAGSLLLTNLSTEQLVGLNGAAFGDGLAVMAWEVVAGLSLVLMAIYFLPRYLARGITTIPQFLAGRFNDTTESITNAIFILAYAAILLPIILYTGARGLSGILDLHELTGIQDDRTILWIVVWMIGIIGSIYAIFGGLRTVAISDTLNGFGLLVGGVLIAYLGLNWVGDGNAMEGWSTMRDAEPERFNSLGGPESSVPWPTLFTGVLLLNMFYWTTNQQIIQRTFAAKSLAEGQKGVLLAAGIKIFAPLILVLPGMMAFHLDSRGQLFDDERVAIMQTEASAELEAMEPDARAAAIADLGDGASEENWINKTVQSKKKDKAYGTLVRQVLPWQLTGFFAAVMVGAILSSFNSALNATATLFSLGIYQRYLRPDADEKAVVGSGRIFGTVIAIVAMFVGPMLAGQDSIFGYLQKMNGLYFIPIFAVVLVGMLDRRVPAWIANVSLVLGFSAIALGYFVFDEAMTSLNIHEFHFLGIVFVALVILMEIVAMTNPRVIPEGGAPDEDESKSPIPMERWALARPVGALLVVAVLLIYGYFATS